MATTTTNFGWDIPQSTDLVKDGATAIAALGQDIDTAFVDLKGGTTGQVLSKASGADLDFSWVAADDTNAIQNSIIDAKGDIIGATGADTPARLAVGTNGQILTADSTAATGIKWADPASGGGMTLLQTLTLSGASTTSSTLSTAYKSLVCYFYGVQVIGVNSGIRIRVNSNTGSNYGNAFLSDSNTTYTVTTETSMRMVDFVPTPTGNCAGKIEIPQYANTGITVKHAFVTQTNDVARTMILNGYIKETAAITSLTFATLSAATFAGTVQIYGVN